MQNPVAPLPLPRLRLLRPPLLRVQLPRLPPPRPPLLLPQLLTRPQLPPLKLPLLLTTRTPRWRCLGGACMFSRGRRSSRLRARWQKAVVLVLVLELMLSWRILSSTSTRCD